MRASTPKTFAAALGFVLLASGVVAVVSRKLPSTDPLFDGRTVSAWVLDLNSPRAAARQDARAEVARFDSNALPALLRLLNTPDPLLARPLLNLGWRAPQKFRNALLRLVGPYTATVQRLNAAQALEIMGSNAAPARPDLSRALGDPAPAVAYHAAAALARLGEPGRAALIRALAPQSGLKEAGRSSICYALGTQGETASNAVPVLVRQVEGQNTNLATSAAQALWNIGRPAVPALQDCLGNPDEPVRILAAQTLGRIGPVARPALPRLIDLVHAASAGERATAVTAIAHIQPYAKPVTLALAQALRDPDYQVRVRAVEGLARSPRTAGVAVPRLIELLRDPGPDLRIQVAALLGQIPERAEEIVAALQRSSSDTNELVRLRAREALAERSSH